MCLSGEAAGSDLNMPPLLSPKPWGLNSIPKLKIKVLVNCLGEDEAKSQMTTPENSFCGTIIILTVAIFIRS